MPGKYDQAGRMVNHINGGGSLDATYDAWSNLTSRNINGTVVNSTYLNNRNLATASDNGNTSNTATIKYDGDSNYVASADSSGNGFYFIIRSSVLGGAVVSKVEKAPTYTRHDGSYTYADGKVLMQYQFGYPRQVVHETPDNGGLIAAPGVYVNDSVTSFNVLGMFVQGNDHPPSNPDPYIPMADYYSDNNGCYEDGFRKNCNQVVNNINNNISIPCPNGQCGPGLGRDAQGRSFIHGPFRAYADGRSGYWIDENDPNHVLPTDPDTIDGGGIRTRFIGVGGDNIWNIRPWLQKRFEAGLECDLRLSRIFGDSDAMMATNTEPNTLLNSNGTNRSTRTRNNPYDESPQLGTIHLFSNAQGTGVNRTNAFTPAGYAATETNHYNTSSGELQNFRRFYYNPGSLSKYGYSGGLIANFTHIGPTTRIGNHILQGTGSRNDMGSVPVGVIGGFGSTPEVGGGSEGFYTHVHMIFNTWNGSKSSRANPRTRVDPRRIFCKDLGF